MSTGWLILLALAVVAVGWFLVAVGRGVVKTARTDTRQDLIKLGYVPETAQLLTKGSTVPIYCFMAPFEGGRSHPFGWLWWRVERDTDGEAKRTMGWALTYRRARKAAGLPLSLRAHHTEILLAPGHQRLPEDGQLPGPQEETGQRSSDR